MPSITHLASYLSRNQPTIFLTSQGTELGEVRGPGRNRYLRVINASGHEEQVIVVRPFPAIAPAGVTVDVISSAG